MKIVSSSVGQTRKIASKFAKKLKPGDLVALYGELGAGKTTFVKAVAKALGIKKRIISPTFILVRSYKIPHTFKGSTLHAKILNHVDLYRIKSAEDLHVIDLNEIIKDKNHITFIEWARKAESILPKKRINIKIEYKQENTRLISIERK